MLTAVRRRADSCKEAVGPELRRGLSPAWLWMNDRLVVVRLPPSGSPDGRLGKVGRSRLRKRSNSIVRRVGWGALRSGGIVRRVMESTDYKSILAAVEKALKICDESVGYMDAIHRKICEDLHDARRQLLKLMNAQKENETG